MFDVFLIRAVRAIRMLKKLEQCSAVFNHRGHGDTEVAEVDPCEGRGVVDPHSTFENSMFSSFVRFVPFGC
jgi:hypothetical protein